MNTEKIKEKIAEFYKVLAALRLELPESVANDVTRKLYELESELQQEQPSQELRDSSISSHNQEQPSGEVEKQMDELIASIPENERKEREFEERKSQQQEQPSQCNHNWVSSVAYKGARICTKCQTLK